MVTIEAIIGKVFIKTRGDKLCVDKDFKFYTTVSETFDIEQKFQYSLIYCI
jgi:hypothetical protein